MTGRELIIHILQNNLEDEQIFEDGKLAGFLTVKEAAAKLNVGAATVLAWVNLGFLDYVVLGDIIYIPNNINKTEENVIE